MKLNSKMLSALVKCASSDLTRPALQNAFFQKSDPVFGGPTLSVTDGHRLVNIAVELEEHEEAPDTCLIPVEAFKEKNAKWLTFGDDTVFVGEWPVVLEDGKPKSCGRFVGFSTNGDLTFPDTKFIWDESKKLSESAVKISLNAALLAEMAAAMNDSKVLAGHVCIEFVPGSGKPIRVHSKSDGSTRGILMPLRDIDA